MKKRLLLFFVTIILLLSTVASIPPANSKAVTASSIFRGAVIGTDLSGKFIEFYINHQEQMAVIPIKTDAQGNHSYSVSIPMEGVPQSSTVSFKVEDVVYGFGRLEGSSKTLDLRADEQSH